MPRRKSQSQYVGQQAKFFSLPAELRNQIYEESIKDTTSVSMRGDILLYAPPLSLVCRQIRHEYESIYLNEALSHATDYHIHITNFVCKGAALRRVQDLLRQGSRTVKFHVYLTNMYDQYRLEMRQLIEGKPLRSEVPSFPMVSPKYDICVRWNPESFDVDFFKQTIRKLNWYYGTSHAMYEGKSNWIRVRGAFEDAIKRYQPNGLPKTPARKRGSQKRRAQQGQINALERSGKRHQKRSWQTQEQGSES